MGIVDEVGIGPVFLDTSVFIYLIEENPNYLKIVLPLFEAIDQGLFVGIISGITLLETLVVPLRTKDFDLADKYELLLSNSSGIVMQPLDNQLLREAAYLRALFGLKTPDALQIAAARKNNCTVFVTNDRRLSKIANLHIVQLSDYVEKL